MVRLLNLAFFIFYSFTSISQSIKILPLQKNSVSGPLGSTVYFFREADSTNMIIPDSFFQMVDPDSIQVKYYDFDQNKKTFIDYKKGLINYEKFQRKFNFQFIDTATYNKYLEKGADDRIYMIYAFDRLGNLIVMIDQDNNNIFDDGVYYVTSLEYYNKSVSVTKDIRLLNVEFIGIDTIVKYDFDIKLNLKPLNTVIRKDERKTLISFEFHDNYFGRFKIDSLSLEINTRPFHPQPFVDNSNMFLYLSGTNERLPNLRTNDMPFLFGDTVQVGSKSYVVSSHNSKLDSIKLTELSLSVSKRKLGIGDYIELPENGIDNLKIDASLFKGKFILIDFWGTWCKPCLDDMANMSTRYQNILSQKDIQVLGFLYDKFDRLEFAKSILKKYNITCPQVFEDMDKKYQNSYVKKLNVNVFPQYFLIDQRGKIIYKSTKLNEVINFYESLHRK